MFHYALLLFIIISQYVECHFQSFWWGFYFGTETMLQHHSLIDIFDCSRSMPLRYHSASTRHRRRQPQSLRPMEMIIITSLWLVYFRCDIGAWCQHHFVKPREFSRYAHHHTCRRHARLCLLKLPATLSLRREAGLYQWRRHHVVMATVFHDDADIIIFSLSFCFWWYRSRNGFSRILNIGISSLSRFIMHNLFSSPSPQMPVNWLFAFGHIRVIYAAQSHRRRLPYARNFI